MTRDRPLLDPARAAFDIDGVTVDIVAPFLRLLKERHGYGGFTPEDITNFNLEKALGLPGEVVEDLIEELVERPLAAGVQLHHGAEKALKKLAEKAPLLFVTARNGAKQTRAWLEVLLKDLPPDRWNVAAAGDPLNKLKYLTASNRHVFFDDNLATCRQLASAGLSVYVFDQPWNRADNTLPRVSGWSEVERLFGLTDRP